MTPYYEDELVTLYHGDALEVLPTIPAGSWTFCNWRTLPVVMRSALDASLPITSLLVWDKEWIGPGGSQGLRPSYELVALSAGPDFAIPDRGVPDIWRCQVGSYKERWCEMAARRCSQGMLALEGVA